MHTFFQRFGPWLVFLGVLAWRWRTELFTHLPSYGDVLEVIWGMQWYADSLTRGEYPVYTPLLFHPNGWYIASFGYTPTILLSLVPLYWLGGAAFAYNISCLVSFVVAFGGSLRLARQYVPLWVATIAALVFTFAGYRWARISGHINILWATSLLPWLYWALTQARVGLLNPSAAGGPPPAAAEGDEATCSKGYAGRYVILVGVLWGLLIHCNLYSLFWGALAFLLWGRGLWTWRGLRHATLSAVIALAISAPLFGLYIQGTQTNQFPPPSPFIAFEWGASLNSLPIPPHFHPHPSVMALARWVYPGPYDESGVFNLGLVTVGLGVIGGYVILRGNGRPLAVTLSGAKSLTVLTVVGLVLGLGWALRWNGAAVGHPSLVPLNTVIWSLGHWLKPAAFAAPAPPPPFDTGLPLPGLVLAILVPFMEAARVTGRYALVGGLALIVVASIGLRYLPRWLALPLALLWVAEAIPPATRNVPFPTPPHPVYTWLAEQPLEAGEGIIDIILPSYVMTGGEAAYATAFHGRPTANGIGSFWPEYTAILGDRLKNGGGLASLENTTLLHQLGIRYVLVHARGAQERQLWQQAQNNPTLRSLGCWEPAGGPSPWPYPICIAEVQLTLPKLNLIRTKGWSYLEEWGVWAEGQHSEARWVATTRADHRLIIEARPMCVPGQRQRVDIEINGVPLDGFSWSDCHSRQETLTIPGSLVKLSWNEVRLRYRYTARPIDVTGGVNIDSRALAVGFSQLRVERVK